MAHGQDAPAAFSVSRAPLLQGKSLCSVMLFARKGEIGRAFGDMERDLWVTRRVREKKTMLFCSFVLAIGIMWVTGGYMKCFDYFDIVCLAFCRSSFGIVILDENIIDILLFVMFEGEYRRTRAFTLYK